MPTRHLYIARHGAADPFGRLTDAGERQSALLAERLARLPVSTVWHSPLPRASRTARIIGGVLPGVEVRESAALVDHVPHVPDAIPPGWTGFFDGYDAAEAAGGARTAAAMVRAFARPSAVETHEVVVTHAYPVAWLVRHALDAPPARWLDLNCGNAALTVIEYRDSTTPTLVLYNDMGHLPAELRWTGFRGGPMP
jgi:serine/threonine-protein phosphatase PGAM5